MKSRYISTHFWSDAYIRSVDYITRYVYLYLLTNEHTNICHVYELAYDTMCFETSLDSETLKIALSQLEDAKKIIYVENYMILRNSRKHQSTRNTNIQKCILREFSELPKKIKKIVENIENYWKNEGSCKGLQGTTMTLRTYTYTYTYTYTLLRNSLVDNSCFLWITFEKSIKPSTFYRFACG